MSEYLDHLAFLNVFLCKKIIRIKLFIVTGESICHVFSSEKTK